MSVASILAAAGVFLLGYRTARSHQIWKGIRVGNRAARLAHRSPWPHTALMILGAVALVAGFFFIGFDLSH